MVGVLARFGDLIRVLSSHWNYSSDYEYSDRLECAHRVYLRIYSAWPSSGSDDIQDIRIYYDVSN